MTKDLDLCSGEIIEVISQDVVLRSRHWGGDGVVTVCISAKASLHI